MAHHVLPFPATMLPEPAKSLGWPSQLKACLEAAISSALNLRRAPPSRRSAARWHSPHGSGFRGRSILQAVAASEARRNLTPAKSSRGLCTVTAARARLEAVVLEILPKKVSNRWRHFRKVGEGLKEGTQSEHVRFNVSAPPTLGQPPLHRSVSRSSTEAAFAPDLPPRLKLADCDYLSFASNITNFIS